MTAQQWLLTDHKKGVYVEQLTLGPEQVGGNASGYVVSKYRCYGGLQDGVDVLKVSTGRFLFFVLPTRGMGIWQGSVDGHSIGWKSPVQGPIHPHFVPLGEPSGLGWLDGFDELLVRCGLVNNGAPDFDDSGRLVYPLHGRIANRSAHRVAVEIDGDTGEIAISGEVDDVRFHFAKLRLKTTIRTHVGETRLTIHDEIINLSDGSATAQMLYHVNLGPPFLESGSQLVAPVEQVAPRSEDAVAGLDAWTEIAGEKAGFREEVYFAKLHGDEQAHSEVLMKNRDATLGVGLRFNLGQLPYFTLWKNTTAEADGYTTGMEPATNFPNQRSFETEHNRVITIPPGGNYKMDLTLEIHTTPEAVAQREAAIAKLQATAPAKVMRQPIPQWCSPS